MSDPRPARHDDLAAPQGQGVAGAPDMAAADAAIAVSLLVSTRDRSAFLSRTLASFERIESRRTWELILVDNASTDATWSLLEAFARASKHRVRLLREPRPGLSHARNAGVRAAAGRILCFTDDDCYPRPDFIDAVADVFERNDIGFMGGQVLLFDPQDAPVCITKRTRRVDFPPGSFLANGEVQGACMAFRREVFDQVGLFDTAFGAGAPLKAAEDCEMTARASFAGWKGGYFPEPVVYHHHRRRGEGALHILQNYDYARGAYYAKLIARYPRRRRGILKEWYWSSPVSRQASPTACVRLWRELRGACRYALAHAGADPLP